MERKLVYLLAVVFLFSSFPVPKAAAQATGEGYSMKKIVLDPGHGGHDPGCTSGRFKEKDIVLSIALRIGELINQNLPDVEVVYTRKTDVFIELIERGNIANRAKSDLFLSIHADAIGRAEPNGSSSWVMGLSREKSNLELAMRENSVITYEDDYQTKYEGFDPNDPASYIMFALMQSAHLDQGIKLATLIQKQYKANTTISTTRGVRQNVFMVLHRTTMPSVLTEVGFLSNTSDRAYMTSKEGQEKIARSIFNAISEYKSQVEGNAQIITLDNAGREHSTPAPVPAGQAVTPASPAFVTGGTHSGTIFRVQVSASTSRINTASRSRFGNFAGKLTEIRIGNYYKYFFGETKSYSEALSLQRQAREKFRDAFVVAFENGEPVPVTDAMKRN